MTKRKTKGKPNTKPAGSPAPAASNSPASTMSDHGQAEQDRAAAEAQAANKAAEQQTLLQRQLAEKAKEEARAAEQRRHEEEMAAQAQVTRNLQAQMAKMLAEQELLKKQLEDKNRQVPPPVVGAASASGASSSAAVPPPAKPAQPQPTMIALAEGQRAVPAHSDMPVTRDPGQAAMTIADAFLKLCDSDAAFSQQFQQDCQDMYYTGFDVRAMIVNYQHVWNIHVNVVARVAALVASRGTNERKISQQSKDIARKIISDSKTYCFVDWTKGKKPGNVVTPARLVICMAPTSVIACRAVKVGTLAHLPWFLRLPNALATLVPHGNDEMRLAVFMASWIQTQKINPKKDKITALRDAIFYSKIGMASDIFDEEKKREFLNREMKAADWAEVAKYAKMFVDTIPDHTVPEDCGVAAYGGVTIKFSPPK